MIVHILLALVLAYLVGAIPAAAWIARLKGVDIRTVGSGNSGATNVQRTLGWGPGLAVAFFDIAKGAVAVWLARQLGLLPEWAALVGIMAILGHNFSVFLGFRGGKGVATSFGTIIAIDPLVGACVFAMGVFTVSVTRYVSAGSLVGGAVAVVTAAALGRPLWELGLLLALCVLVVWQHRENIQRLQAGNERHIGKKVEAGR
ncbi:glycerol-3-phosphate acyltransferase [Deinococcus irradiatisoli]|uniref:Glycerol-3-phosphate acyltransferase n=1 Tax=Deinococcus irradiatisoli TaxID=2202254 RepID=A0A2Z3JCQ3_9DEIO|nr:glycerol-3-phosphate 1-O-acyltransferase PlsY [Deinococcus irradiatisoli]AWN22943.1 glycerol-3-phosphate acyltransferase [Deinococcus irradiatisoli]